MKKVTDPLLEKLFDKNIDDLSKFKEIAAQIEILRSHNYKLRQEIKELRNQLSIMENSFSKASQEFHLKELKRKRKNQWNIRNAGRHSISDEKKEAIKSGMEQKLSVKEIHEQTNIPTSTIYKYMRKLRLN